jgi:hypothetical protein
LVLLKKRRRSLNWRRARALVFGALRHKC